MRRWVGVASGSRYVLIAFVAISMMTMPVSGSPDGQLGMIKVTSPPPPPKPYYYIEDLPNVCDNTPYVELQTYDDVVGLYRQIAANPKYAGFIKMSSPNQQYGYGTMPGTTGTEKDLQQVRLTNEALGLHKPEVFFPGPPHGDEDIGVETNVYFAHWLLKYALDPDCKDMANEGPTEWLKWILDNREIYLWSGMNPCNYNKARGTCRYGGGSSMDGNREYDHTQCNGASGGCGSQAVGFLRSVSGATVATFMQKHQVRVGADYHGGTFAMLYSFGASHQTSSGAGRVPGCGRQVEYAPPDLYWYDHWTLLKVNKYLGANPNSGSFTCTNTGTPFSQVGYNAAGTYLDAWYASHPSNVKEFTGGNTLVRCYSAATCTNSLLAGADCNPAGTNPCKMDLPTVAPNGWTGAGVLWLTPETGDKGISSNWGSDKTKGWASYWRRFHLINIDMAEPNLRWAPGTPAEGAQVAKGSPVSFKWIVNGSMVVDDTQLFWSKTPDPMTDPAKMSAPAHLDYKDKDSGGTGWEGANEGKTSPYIWTDPITFDTEGVWYVQARAKVDQIYGVPCTGTSPCGIFNTAQYGTDSYLKVIKQRTKPGWSETIQGEDGPETMAYQEYWTSSVRKVTVGQDTTPPTVVLTSPADQAQNVAPNSKLVVTFSEPMNTASAQTAFSLAPALAGTSTWDPANTVMTFTPSAAMQTTTAYTGTVATGATDVAGNAMTAAKTWTFTTSASVDLDPPKVVSTDPLPAATGINPASVIKITFNESMDAGTAGPALTISPAAPGTITWPSGIEMQYKPNAALAELTKHTVTVAKTASDLAGNQMTADHVFDFTTGSKPSDVDPPSVIATSPSPDVTGVPLNKKIEITWSEAVKPAGSESGFSTAPVTNGTFSWLGHNMTYTPAANLAMFTNYTVTIKAGVEDLVGNKMGSDYSFKFMTGGVADTTPPTVITVAPLDGSTDVTPSAEIAVKFSEPIDSSMIGMDTTAGSFIGWDVNPAPLQGKGLGKFDMSGGGRVFKYEPKAFGTGKPGFDENTKYTVVIYAGLEDLAGNQLVTQYTWTFTTGYNSPILANFKVGDCSGIITCYDDGAYEIESSHKAYVNFNKPMDKTGTQAALSFEPSISATYAWKTNDSAVEITAGGGGFKTATPYKLTLKGSAKSAKGQPLADDVVWTFTTKGYKPGTTPPPAPKNDDLGTFLSSPMGIGIILAILLAVIGVALLAVMLGRKKKKQKAWQQAYQQQNMYGGPQQQQGWDQGQNQGYGQPGQTNPNQQQWPPPGGQGGTPGGGNWG